MKKLLLILFVTGVAMSSCSKSGKCSYNGHELKQGSKDGCYYINSKGNKEYVDRSNCNCGN